MKTGHSADAAHSADRTLPGLRKPAWAASTLHPPLKRSCYPTADFFPPAFQLGVNGNHTACSFFFLAPTDLIMLVGFTLGVGAQPVASTSFIFIAGCFPYVKVPQPLALRLRTHRELVSVCEVRWDPRFIFRRWLSSDQDC